MANRPDWQDGRGPLLRRELDRIYTAIWPLFTPRLTVVAANDLDALARKIARERPFRLHARFGNALGQRVIDPLTRPALACRQQYPKRLHRLL